MATNKNQDNTGSSSARARSLNGDAPATIMDFFAGGSKTRELLAQAENDETAAPCGCNCTYQANHGSRPFSSSSNAQ
jgi:hypothetical protein